MKNTFKGWDGSLTGIFADRTIKAVYNSKVREYTVKYVSKGLTLQESTGQYGSYIKYEGDTPTYTAEESAYKYNLFKGWDKSGFVDGDKTINAVYETCEYVDGCLTLKLTVDGTTTDNIAVKGLGSAAYTNTSAYATAAQGALATNAVRKVVSGTANGTISVTTGTGAATDIAVKGLGSAAYKGAGASQGQVPVNGAALGTTANVPVVTNTSGQLVPHASGALGSAAFKGAETFATAAQGAKADKSVQSVSITSGTNNGTIKLTVNGNATDNIAVKGLGSAAYTASGAYATSAQGAKADAAMPKAGGTFTGSASFDGTADITLSQMGLNVPVEITKADYLAKKKAGTLNANTYYNVIDEYDSANVINDSSVTANSTFSSTKSEKTYAKKSTLVNTTLTASKWTGSSAPYSYVLSVSGVTSSNIVEIDYASNASSTAIEAYQNAMLADGGQTTNQITIKATEKPTVDIPITIVIRNDL